MSGKQVGEDTLPWCFSWDGESYQGPYATREAVVAALIDDGKHEDVGMQHTVHLGRCKMATHRSLVEGIGACIKERLEEAAYEVWKGAEYPPEEIEKEVEELVIELLVKRFPQPDFFQVEFDEEVDVASLIKGE